MPALGINPVLLGALQTYMKRAHKTPRLRTTTGVVKTTNHSKICTSWGHYAVI